MTQFHQLSAIDLIAGYRSGDFSPVEVTDAVLDRIERLDPKLNAFVTVTPELAREQAQAAERAYREGNAGALAGVPTSIKDLTVTKGIRTTRGSLLFKDWVPDFDPPVMERIYTSGAVTIGKTNSPEYGWKGETTNRVSGTTHNPWKYGLTPGGSSGGGSAAVAIGFGPLAQGSDGAGSIRIPCSFSGIFGLKPSFGLIPQYPPSPSGDISHVGPMTRTVADSALFLTILAGADARDRLSWSSGIDYLAALDRPLPKLRIAWSPNLGHAKVDPEIAALTAQAARALAELGHEVAEATPDVADPIESLDMIWAAGMSGGYRGNLAEVADLIDPGRLAMIEAAPKFSIVDFGAGAVARAAYVDGMRRFMERYDLLLTPTMPCPPFPAGLDQPEESGRPSLSSLGWTPFTYPFNLTGQPAATVPAGFTSAGLPVGLQIVGRFHDDMTVLQASKAFESLRPWAQTWPDDADFS